MILSTPHPPPALSSALPPSHADPGLFIIKPGIRAEEALIAASDYLQCASATAYEVTDNQSAAFRPLARSVVHQVDMARLLVEAALDDLSRPPQVIGES